MAYTALDEIPWKVSSEYDEDWQATWPELRCKEVDPIEVVADLYLPEGLAYHGFVEPFEAPQELQVISGPRVQELAKILRLGEDAIKARERRVKALLDDSPQARMVKIAEEARLYQRQLVEDVFPTFWAYTQAACGGELRHHPSVGGGSGHPLSGSRKAAWVKWRAIWEEHGVDALKLMSKLFLEIKGGSIGGKRWAAASDILIAYHEGKLGPNEFSNKKIFLDRVLALQHNGGCFLSKRTWKKGPRAERDENVRGHKAKYLYTSGQSMKPVLDCHAADPPDVGGLFACASAKVRDMTRRYFAAAEEAGIKVTAGMDSKARALILGQSEEESGEIPISHGKHGKTFGICVKNGITYTMMPKVTFHVTTADGTVVVKTYKFKTMLDMRAKVFYFKHMTKHLKGNTTPTKVDVQAYFGAPSGTTTVEFAASLGSNSMYGHILTAKAAKALKESA